MRGLRGERLMGVVDPTLLTGAGFVPSDLPSTRGTADMMTATCVHRWVIKESAKQPGVCRKCGATRNFGRITYDPLNSQSYTATPTVDARAKVLAYLKRRDGVHVDWEEFRAAAGCSHGALTKLLKGLLDTGDIVELSPLTYALVEAPCS